MYVNILVFILADMLMKALNSLKFSQVAKSVKIKLTNKNYPCLTLEVELVSTFLFLFSLFLPIYLFCGFSNDFSYFFLYYFSPQMLCIPEYVFMMFPLIPSPEEIGLITDLLTFLGLM